MAQIRIREKDNTGSSNTGATSNYIAVRYETATLEGAKIVLLTSDNVDTVLNKMADNTASRIKELYDLGGQVLVVNSWVAAKDYLLDRNQCDVKLLLCDSADNAEADGETGKTTLQLTTEIAAARRDCAVVYGRTASDSSTAWGWTDAETKVLNTALTPADDDFLSKETYAYVGKYVIPVEATDLKGVDYTGKQTVTLPAEFMYANAYLTSINNGNPEWLTIAGSSRGACSISKVSCGPVTESTLNTVQASTKGTRSINPILNANPWGVRIWGARTALPIQADDEGNAKIVASNFANIRILLCDLKKRLYKASKKYQFDQNTDVLWVQFKSYVNTLLDEMKLSYGIAGYRWRKITEGVANNKLACTLQIVPVEPVDDFDITIDLSDTLTVTE